MTDAPVQTDAAGLGRTETGELNNPSIQPTPETTTPPPAEPKTVLNQNEPAPKPEPPKPAEGAPEKYSDFKVPEGYQLDPEVNTKASDLFKSMGLSQDSAQKLVDFYTAETKEAFEAP